MREDHRVHIKDQHHRTNPTISMDLITNLSRYSIIFRDQRVTVTCVILSQQDLSLESLWLLMLPSDPL